MISEPATRQKTVRQPSLAPVWRVVVLNDPVNLMNYVVMVFRKVLGFDEKKANLHMLEVHEKGKSTVWSGNRERAEAYAYELQQWRLQTLLVRDD